MVKIDNFLELSPNFPENFLVWNSGFRFYHRNIFNLLCESWSGINWARRGSPVTAAVSCKTIKMVKFATFLELSRIFPENFLVWKSGFWKLLGKSFHLHLESWSGVNGARRWSARRTEGSRPLTLPRRVLNFSWFDQPSTFERFYVPSKLMFLIRIFFKSQEKVSNFHRKLEIWSWHTAIIENF